MGKKVKRRKKNPSAFSAFTQKMASTLKEIVQAPPEAPPIEEQPEQAQEDAIIIQAEIQPEQSETEEQASDGREENNEIEKDNENHDDIRTQILENLNSATQQWKETGEIGIHLEPPVPLREKMKNIWTNMKHGKSAKLASQLKCHFEEVLAKASQRLSRAKEKGAPIKAEDAIKEEWRDVLTKMESKKPTEREEIDALYSELSK